MIVTGFNGNIDNEYFYEYLLFVLLLSANYNNINTPIKILLNSENIFKYNKLIQKFNLKLDIELIEYSFISKSYNTKYEIIKYFIDEKTFFYLDIDVIFLKNIDYFLKEMFLSDVFYTEKIPEYIKEIEKNYYKIPSYDIFAQWFFLKNKNTSMEVIDFFKNITNHDLEKKEIKSLDLKFSKTINKLEKIEDQSFGAYYPKHKINNKKILFHYDGMIDSGSFIKLKNHNPRMFNYIIYKLKKIKDYEGIQNDEKYFKKHTRTKQ